MKKSYYNFFAGTLVLVIFLVSSCSNRKVLRQSYGWENAAAQGGVFILKKEYELLPEAGGKSPIFDFEVYLLEAGGKLGKLLQNALYDGKTPRKWAEERLAAITAKYKNSMPDASAVLKGKRELSLDWHFYQFDSGKKYNSLAVVRREREIFDGGAHPIHECELFVFDTANEKQVALKEILKPNSNSAVKKLLDDALIKKYAKEAGMPHAAHLSGIGFFEDGVDVSDNFSLSPAGMGFVWQEYTVAPYNFGIIEVIIDYQLIKPYLSNYGQRLFNAVLR